MAKREAMAADPAPEMKTAGEWKKQLGTKEHIFTGTCVRAGIGKIHRSHRRNMKRQ